jgi:hypothetical protein
MMQPPSYLGALPTEYRSPVPAQRELVRRVPLARQGVRFVPPARQPDPFPEPHGVGMVYGKVWGSLTGWQTVGAATVPPPGTTYTFGIGLTEAGGNVDLDAATPAEIGGITEPPADGIYLRNAAGGVYTWQLAAAGTAYIWGIGIDETVPGTIDLMPATQTEIGGLLETPADDLQYVRQTTAGGVSSWAPLAAAPPLDWGVGIDITGIVVDLQPANFAPGEIGGITSEPQSATQGLLLDDATGHLTAPLATDVLAGSIVEPPPDGLVYGRTRDATLGSSWVPVSSVVVADDPPVAPPPTQGMLWYESDSGRLFLYYDDGNSQQWIQVGGR